MDKNKRRGFRDDNERVIIRIHGFPYKFPLSKIEDTDWQWTGDGGEFPRGFWKQSGNKCRGIWGNFSFVQNTNVGAPCRIALK